jgi:tRNA pseudouridine55 synthase
MSKHSTRQVNGIFLLDKPIGISSNQALQRVKRIFNAKKAGHAGTLDVLASGLLVICFGEATKFSQYLLNADKGYRVTAKLGERTTTCDGEGEVIERKPIKHIDKKLLDAVLEKFRGEITQIPSMYSALKHKGQPLYKLARKGVEVERKPRNVIIHKLTLLDWNDDKLSLDVHCSKGTYIRNLVDDIGLALDSCAYVTELRRLGVGSFDASQMFTLEQLQSLYDDGAFVAIDEKLLPISSALAHLPKIILNSEQAKQLKMGRRFYLPVNPISLVQFVEKPNHFIGVGEIEADGRVVSQRLVNTTASSQ